MTETQLPQTGKNGAPDGGSPSPSSYGILLGSQLAVGAAAIFARFALHSAGPVAASALRLSIAAVPMLAISWREARKIGVPRRHELIMAAAGIALAVHFGTWIASLLYTSVAISTLLVCTSPAWTAAYDVLVLKRLVGKGFWLALLSAAVGVGMVATAKSGCLAAAQNSWLGGALAVAGSLALAVYLIAIRQVSHIYPTAVVVGRTYSWAALGLWLGVLLFRDPMPGADLVSWGGIIAMALISQMLGHTGMNASLRWFDASTVAFSTLLEPIFAAVLAAAMFSEAISVQAVIGAIIVLAALACILRVQADTM